ncbi:hypothetical protein EC968_009198 [Mortierella alpina]|nr:hypothetical protein EC968_009198 [Mortierella alpina]
MAPRRRSAANVPAAAAPAAEVTPPADPAAANRDSDSDFSGSEVSEDEGDEQSPMDTSEDAHLSESSQEVEALNRLLAIFTVEDEEEEDFEIGGVGNPTKEDLQKLLSRRKKRLVAKARTLGMIHARFNDAVLQMKQIRLERSLIEDALKRLTGQKEDLLAAVTQECEDIQKDITSIKQSLAFGYEDDEVPQAAEKVEEAPSAKFSVKWNKNDPEHCALYRIFGEEYIPLVEDTQEVDFSKVKKKTFKDSPELDLDVSSLPVEDMVREIARRVVKFRDDFERVFRRNLSDDLFDKMAWDYMPSAISKAGLAKEYQELIMDFPLKQRTWKQVVLSLNKALKFELLEAHLADGGTHGETEAFTQRLTPLIEAAKFPDDGCSVLIKALGNHLSDVGFQATIKEYGSFDEVKSFKKYLEFLTKTPGAMEGSKTNHTLYFIKKYGGKAGAQAADRSQGKPRQEYSDRAPASVLQKRPSPGRDHREQDRKDRDRKGRVYKKPRPGRTALCTYSDKCIKKRLRHELEDCYHWQDD